MADNDSVRHTFFGISMNIDLVHLLKQVVPPEAFPVNKAPLSKQHVTVAYMGDHVYPELYVKLFRKEADQKEIAIKLLSIHSDKKCTSALVSIKDDEISSIC